MARSLCSILVSLILFSSALLAQESTISPEVEDRLARIHEHLEKNEMDQAHALLEETQALVKDGNWNPQAHVRVQVTAGAVWNAQRDYPQMESALQKGLLPYQEGQLARDTNYVAIHLDLSHAYHGMRDLASAVEVLEHIQNSPFLSFTHKKLLVTRLGMLYHFTGRYAEAIRVFKELENIYNAGSIAKDESYVKTLYHLSIALEEMGDFEQAEGYYDDAIRWGEELLGENHKMTIRCLSAKEGYFKIIGRYDKATTLAEEITRRYEKAGMQETVDYAFHMMNTGNLHYYLEDLETARGYYELGLAGTRKLFPPDHQYVSQSLNLIASCCLEQGEVDQAEVYLLEALQIMEGKSMQQHPNYAVLLSSLASVHLERTDFTKAQRTLEDALALARKIISPSDPTFMHMLLNYSSCFKGEGSQQEEAEVMLEVYHTLANGMRYTASFLSTKELEDYFRHKTSVAEQALLYRGIGLANEDLNDALYDYALLSKGALLNNSIHTTQFVMEAGNAETKQVYQSLMDVRSAIGAALDQPSTPSGLLDSLQVEEENLEKKLARLSNGYRKSMDKQKGSLSVIRESLADDEVAIEVVRYLYDQFSDTAHYRYAALVLDPGKEHVAVVPLFAEEKLADLLVNNGQRRMDYVDNLYRQEDRGLSKESDEPSLFDLIWAPLETHVTGATTIYFSPAGLLNRINLAAIPLNYDETVSDRHTLHVLMSTRSIPSMKAATGGVFEDVVLFGGINFDYDSVALVQTATPFGFGDSGETDVAYIRGAGSSTWKYLRGTESECASIEKILQQSNMDATWLSGYSATEEAFKMLGKTHPEPDILHLSTHGYFLEDPDATGDESNRIAQSDHPMVRSGLILAGGNLAWTGGEPLTGQEDGILTAYEISQMNLNDTRLVVLSACETGLGDIAGLEGVYGLQRAFKMAGVDAIVMSLWQVPDRQTKELMTTFYRNFIGEGQSVRQAFAGAQEDLKMKYQVPYFWAGFVLIE